jgi:hypothetical protein
LRAFVILANSILLVSMSYSSATAGTPTSKTPAVVAATYHMDTVENPSEGSRWWKLIDTPQGAAVLNAGGAALGLPGAGTAALKIGDKIPGIGGNSAVTDIRNVGLNAVSITNVRDAGEEHTGAFRAPQGYSVCNAICGSPSVNCNGTLAGSLRTKDDPASGGFDAFWYYVVVPKPGIGAGKCWAECNPLRVTFVRYDLRASFAGTCGKTGSVPFYDSRATQRRSLKTDRRGSPG